MHSNLLTALLLVALGLLSQPIQALVLDSNPTLIAAEGSGSDGDKGEGEEEEPDCDE